VKIILERLKHAWNAFRNNDDSYFYKDLGAVSSISPTVSHFSMNFERSIIYAVCNRMAMDVAAYDIRHVRIDKETGQYSETIFSPLNNCLTVEANCDQTSRAFFQDATMSMFDEGYVAIVPTETDINPLLSGSYDVTALRTGKIIEWYPKYVKIDLYNDTTGQRNQIVLPKAQVAIVENPLYAVMNEPNSTLKRLLRKLALLDSVDEQTSSGKLDLIIQLPYVVKTELRQRQAEERRKAIEQQLTGSKYGIAYIDGTEHITQLNRAVENNLLSQIEYLTKTLYSQLGISEAIFNGTADEKALTNYYDRTIEPLVTAIVDEMKRKFLTKTARTQGQTIMGFRDVFRLIPANEIAEMADSLTRNEILSSNEVRSILGIKPAADPSADELRNKNMPIGDTGIGAEMMTAEGGVDESIASIPYETVQEMIGNMAQEYENTIKELLDGVQKDVDDLLNEKEDQEDQEETPEKEEDDQNSRKEDA